MGTIRYRTATQADAPEIAELIAIASGGMVEFLFQDFAPNLDELLAILTIAVANHLSEMSYNNTDVAVFRGNVVGMANSYPADRHRLTETMKRFFSPERLSAIADFYSSRVEGSFYLSTIAVRENCRSQGIGTALIERVKAKAKRQNFSALSLIVWSDNVEAIRLYQQQQFQPVKRVQVGQHPLLPHANGCILMKCPLM